MNSPNTLTEQEMINRRQSPRQDVRIPSVLIDKKSMSYTTIMDYSEGGIRLRTSIPLNMDDEIELIIKPQNNPSARPIHLKLEVKHCRMEDEENFSIGTQLKNYFGDIMSTLQHYAQPKPSASLSERLGYILA
ncbi:hypothetical protein THMIRHAS_01440 [Thiosulfatimonas sediminis]|uniref:PilZ domain-containing protein n=1 Tax=Thiosulfatimonas sediminis TaxID=2675054 RepID=A0A6F8PRL9_9GAMM|nr:PilZ domain-containing protein [Thiosulfatimonas sediminis]BBP44771.1 hypothetical protein THMIRHAS_01440 [Thiosulfatimonas sediminis]